MENKQKLSPEKLKQIQQLQQLMMNQAKDGKLPPGFPGIGKKPRKFTPKGIFIAILQGMSSCVKFIDYFINFVTKKDKDKSNDVIENARSPIMFGVVVLVFFVFVGIIWSSFAPLDSAAVAIGTVVSSSQKKIINHQEGGIIRKIYVNQGDEVKKNDPLIEFDYTRIKATYETRLNQYRTLLASENRLIAELNEDKSVTYDEFLMKDISDPRVAKIIETQNNLFTSNREFKRAEKDSTRQQIKQYEKEIEGLNAKKIALKKKLEYIRDKVSSTKKLTDKGYAQKTKLLEYESNEADIMSEIAVTDTSIAKAQQAITKTEIDLINLDSKFSTRSLQELKDTQVNLANEKESFFASKDSLDRIIIRSPVDGVVNKLNYHTIGESIPPNASIIEVSPSDDYLVIEAKIEPKHIDSIRVGLKSKIRFSAFKSRTTPMFTGKVVLISPDIIVDQGQQMNPALANGYYLSRIELDMEKFNEMADPRGLVLHPGMQAEVQIVTGTRPLIKYLLDPALDAMFKGFKEK